VVSGAAVHRQGVPHAGTADENHVAQTAISAVCGFSSPNWPKAADLPEREAVKKLKIDYFRP